VRANNENTEKAAPAHARHRFGQYPIATHLGTH
jgi:hypothetical protein